MKSITTVAQIILLFVLTPLFFSSCESEATTDTEDVAVVDVEAQIEALISQMTLEEKITMIHASSSFTSGGVERLGIPELVMSDGPHGVRHEHGRDWEKDLNVRDSSTYLPVGTALAATWNPELGYAFGSVLGSEANFRGKDVILGPGLNIIRSPLNGRNFEYLTEDPYLNAQMVVGYIKGVQDQGIAACAKHYVANNLEFEREKVNVEMSDRALHEIYLPGFKAAVQQGNVLTVMAAYNKFRGEYCAHNGFLLDDILKESFGFQGAVISDWNAVKGTMESVNVGMDLEMGTDLSMLGSGKELDYSKFHMGDTLITLVNTGVVDVAVIDEKVRRLLRVMFATNMFDERSPGAYNTKEHQQVARQIADEAIVLLKNDDKVLPLKKADIQTLAVVGANANRKHAGAGGSSQVKAYYEVTALEGLQNLAGESMTVNFSEGYQIKKDGGADAALIAEAVRNVAAADAAIYVGGWIHGYSDEWNDNALDAEATDKPDMNLPFGQDELIQALLKANPNTIIVLMGGGPVDMQAWKADAKGILQAWYPGMEGGNALASILFGLQSPSGKLPMTFPEKLSDSPAHKLAQFPVENLQMDYTDDIYVGYRYFDSYDVAPAFPFGHGLSYTTFSYEDLSIEKTGGLVTVSLKITNTGDMAGAEVVQLYVKDEDSTLKRPEKELKAFQKVLLQPGESKTIQLELKEDAFSYYDDTQNKWILEAGTFTLLAGSSSRDIRLEGQLDW
ncbi:MAG: glycoside hydrolase family 3 C-terminal domain-containing protein [Saprospiraceae bacterium]|nr:glycoside hydrolase family 3 C-terminal domain-containing protein [Saprospiraceae bacterium]